ncbi:anaphase-promoting complex subunit 5-like [Rhododendron vialii]|uniref:anaphase-promoting complex subunit 5-like n=1 Tax=Rhododendron vialii TaxID=182163 RepID=UPI00265DFF90|nr:anaphase-promoting complex subunit 5-like [Rhododendron vialii]
MDSVSDSDSMVGSGDGAFGIVAKKNHHQREVEEEVEIYKEWELEKLRTRNLSWNMDIGSLVRSKVKQKELKACSVTTPIYWCWGWGNTTVFHKILRQSLPTSTSQQRKHNNDTCLAYTLAAICNLLSEVGISVTSGILGTSNSPGTPIGTFLSIQQQLLVLLRRSLKGAESLKLKRLVAWNHVSMAKFYLMELRLSFSDVFSEFSSEDSTMIMDGAFCAARLKNFQKSTSPSVSVFSQDNGSGSKSDALHFCALPSSIPGSVLQVLGSSYLVQLHGRCMEGIFHNVL